MGSGKVFHGPDGKLRRLPYLIIVLTNPLSEALARCLEDEAGLRPFLDKWHLVPGEPWQEALEDALDASRTCAVFIGPSDIGPWENEEMRSALDTRVSNTDFRVIPVILPGATMPERQGVAPFSKTTHLGGFSRC